MSLMLIRYNGCGTKSYYDYAKSSCATSRSFKQLQDTCHCRSPLPIRFTADPMMLQLEQSKLLAEACD